MLNRRYYQFGIIFERNKTVLELIRMSKDYGSEQYKVSALRSVTVAFRDSEFVSILGPSGCGKTTLLNIIGGLDVYTTGDLVINGVSTRKYTDSDWDTYRNHSVGFVFQSYNLIPHQTVLSNVELALTLSGVSKTERRRRAEQALEKVGLSDQLHKKPNQMSGGQMQRVAIARALVNDPEILLADEPTGALDTATSIQILDLLKEISQDRLVIMVTHNPELAEKYSTRIVSLLDGRVTDDTDPYYPSQQGEDAAGAALTGGDAAGAALTGGDAAGAALTGEDAAGAALTGGDAAGAALTGEDAAGAALTGEDAAGAVLTGEDTVSAALTGEKQSDSSLKKHPETKERRPSKKGKRTKKSMSFFTALSLSFNNLMTKRARTILTSFAGSIGIIGIALILAVSTGVQAYIDSVQRDTLSSYPITINRENVNLAAMFTVSEDDTSSEHENDAVYSNPQLYKLFNMIFAPETRENNLSAFKEFLDTQMDRVQSTTGLYEHVSAIEYIYDVPLNFYVESVDGEYISCDLAEALQSVASQDSGEVEGLYEIISANLSSINLWQQMQPGTDGKLFSDMLKEQYDVVYGEWPSEADEIVLVLDENNEISDIAFYVLGYMSSDEIAEMAKNAFSGEQMEYPDRRVEYSDICGKEFKLVMNWEYYTKSDGLWKYIGDNEEAMEMILDNAMTVRISGIIRKNPDASAGALSAPLAYTSALTAEVMEKTAQSQILQEQLASENSNRDIFTGLPFVSEDLDDMSDEEKAAAVLRYFSELDNKEKAELYVTLASVPSEEYIKQMVESALAEYDTREKMIEFIAGAMGMDKETIGSYLESYSDEKIRELLAQQLEKAVAESYAQTVKSRVEAIMNTPDENETAYIVEIILSKFSGKDEKAEYIVNDWAEGTGIDRQTLEEYVYSLSDEDFEKALYASAAKEAAVLYAGMSSQFEESRYAKVAAVFDAEYGAQTDTALLSGYYDICMPTGISGTTLENNLSVIGAADEDNPSSISIYALSFEDKDVVSSIIREYNESVGEDDEIQYTDYIALLLSGITTIINAISYVLIAFVAISLVVSSIMIGIITYISVLERTKEIGILRAIGASKRDVSLVFNAETIIVGLAAGLIGIGLSALLCLPINAIIQSLSGIQTLRAFLKPLHCVILVVISVFLTMIAGLIPSRIAAKKDPVEALRTE